MNDQIYKKQINLLLSVLPVVSLEDSFALHGGTAINLFVRNMPRLSVDIDLTYLPIHDRKKSLISINAALQKIKQRIENTIPSTTVVHKLQEAKLLVSNNEAVIKVEVNLVKRGCFSAPNTISLCERAQQEFNAFCEMKVVDDAHLFGGKICAALDRQHPRDMFDIQTLLDSIHLKKDLKKGFIFYLISSNRPTEELLFPHLKDQRTVFYNQFQGMTNEPFSYKNFENTRSDLIKTIHKILTPADKEFLLSIEMGEPVWDIYDFRAYPAIQWKLWNIEQLKTNNAQKHQALCDKLKYKLEQIG